MSESRVHVFGVRHHGPGSARSLEHALRELKPDAILVEGPPDAQELIELAGHKEMKPPVALLVYVPDDPRQSVFYPFAMFSPEWIAIQHGLSRGVPVRFMDLPQSRRLKKSEQPPVTAPEGSGDQQDTSGPADTDDETEQAEPRDATRVDPLSLLAQSAGYEDGERWWDALVESRQSAHAEVFKAVADAMIAVRQQVPENNDLDLKREAFMRQSIRTAMKEGFERIAVVCGAWHVPALREPDKTGQVKQDAALLKGLFEVKTKAAWVPWSYDRLSYWSGYGAGVASPEWYHLLWARKGNPAVRWLTKAARIMRKQDLDASSAHIIEGVRLAESLAAMRGRPLPGLQELDEAALTVMCFANEAPMQLIRRELVIGRRLGEIPENAPTIPLQQDLTSLQKRLRMPVTADEKDYDLDLRKDLDLERSRLLHRLRLIKVAWGERLPISGKKGTFHEAWRVQWQPEFAVAVIDAGRWGNTVEEAATSLSCHTAQEAKDLTALVELLDDALLANLPTAVSTLVTAIQERTALSGDIPQLMATLPPLARVTRYGNVRKTDVDTVLEVVTGMVARICVGLAGACSSLNDDAAHEMFDRLLGVNDAISLLQQEEHLDAWRTTLRQLADQAGLHGLIAGRACRVLHDAKAWEPEETERRLSLALSTANAPAQAAAWVEGFLTGSGLLLVHDESLWRPIDRWVVTLSEEHFVEVLPLLRRTFSTFATGERRQLGERISKRAAGGAGAETGEAGAFNYERAESVLPVLARILGLEQRHE